MQRSRLSNYETGKDRSKTITDLLLKHYPEIVNYELDDEFDGLDLKGMYDRAQEKIKMQDKQTALLEELLEQYRKSK